MEESFNDSDKFAYLDALISYSRIMKNLKYKATFGEPLWTLIIVKRSQCPIIKKLLEEEGITNIYYSENTPQNVLAKIKVEFDDIQAFTRRLNL